MECAYYRESLCRSCTNIETPYPAQLAAKQADARRLLAAYPHLTWLEPVASDEAHFRNKAKLVVGGSAQASDFVSTYITKKSHFAYSCYC